MAATAKLRADVKRHAVKSRQNSKGAHVGYMDPRYFQVPLGGATAAKKKAQQQFAAPSWPPVEAAAVAAARWICLPYFALQRCAGLLSASSLASFPPLTLLQSHYSRTPQQRDLEQAVCELGAAPRGDCFHVAQLWCLVLDNSEAPVAALPESPLVADGRMRSASRHLRLHGPVGSVRPFSETGSAAVQGRGQRAPSRLVRWRRDVDPQRQGLPDVVCACSPVHSLVLASWLFQLTAGPPVLPRTLWCFLAQELRVYMARSSRDPRQLAQDSACCLTTAGSRHAEPAHRVSPVYPGARFNEPSNPVDPRAQPSAGAPQDDPGTRGGPAPSRRRRRPG